MAAAPWWFTESNLQDRCQIRLPGIRLNFKLYLYDGSYKHAGIGQSNAERQDMRQ